MDALRGWFTSLHYNKIPDSKDEKKPINMKSDRERFSDDKNRAPSFRSSNDKARDQAQKLLDNKYF